MRRAILWILLVVPMLILMGACALAEAVLDDIDPSNGWPAKS